MEYQKLTVWQESFSLAVSIHSAFKTCRDYGLKDQISRSAVSTPSNIAEGEERETRKESVRFLYYAKGSCGELVTQLMLAKEFGYIESDLADSLLVRALKISKMIAGLIKYRSGSVKEPSAIYDNFE
ncbi:four helix bundle protein [Photobacterium alginatilyticum]|uniref:Four helix bundle protein n=1 Tax=Photobacterium alginatilyticum TaxID=1775171 RepID=A0ABW9YDE3_9GAMM|nr:four helix bundle protein [Photobacterium alginatilyticum]NBI51598.1 four helix bundle protein [Photobacterium alginatilyticum]